MLENIALIYVAAVAGFTVATGTERKKNNKTKNVIQRSG
jgi:hypothetical protein